MSAVFSSAYAEAYDLIYQDKNYAAECQLLEDLFQTYGGGGIRSVLDLGCGTGNHAILLAQRGYEVVGVDRSADMLAHARRKVPNPSSGSGVVFQEGDVRSVDLQRRFDAALLMFAVLSYQLENADVLSTLRSARRSLRAGGILIFDVWYGPSVLHQRPSTRVKMIPTPKGQILRIASGELDIRRHVCTVHYHVWRLEEERVVADTVEGHRVRFFFPLELELFLECAGFALLRLGAFPEFERDPDEMTWNALGVARAV